MKKIGIINNYNLKGYFVVKTVLNADFKISNIYKTDLLNLV